METRTVRPTDFSLFVDDYFDALFVWNPSEATSAGIHDYDSKFADFSRSAHLRRIDSLTEFRKRLRRIVGETLSASDRIDAEILDARIQAELLDLRTLESWRKNPINYVWLLGESIDGLMKRDFAPPSDRLSAITSRLAGVPAALDAMRDNVENPPREFTDLAVRIARGSAEFFGNTMTDWATSSVGTDDPAIDAFRRAQRTAADALSQATAWLENELLPRSEGEYAIGEEAFAAKLRHEEMLDIPLDELLAIGESNLARDHRHFIETARRIDPDRSPEEVMRSLSDDFPSAQNLIPRAKETIDGIVRFLEERQIVTVPSDVRPLIEETPPYFRFGAFAAMDTPGPYEDRAREAFYYLTPPEEDWSPEHREEHLRLFNRKVMELITIHEAYPGHYIQFLYADQFPTKTRKLLSCYSNVEGWAHYTEQMMVEEGYGQGDERIRLAQLLEALLRDCRWVVGMKLHTAGMTVEEGARVFIEQGFQEPANAYEEARRGTYDPTYLAYTLGKLQVYKLRDDYRKAKGSQYSLRAFHDDFVRQGGIPIKLVRRQLLGEDSGRTLYPPSPVGGERA